MRLFRQVKSEILCLGFSPEGRTLTATCRGGMKLALWQLPDGRFRRWHPYADTWVRCFAYSPDSQWLVVGNNWGMALPYIRARDNYNSELHAGNPFGDKVPIYGLAVASGRAVVAAASIGVSLWDLGEGNGVWGETLPGPETHGFGSVAWAPNDRLIAATKLDNPCVAVWQLDHGFRARGEPTYLGYTNYPSAVAFSPDSRTLAVAEGSEVDLSQRHRGWWRQKASLRGHAGKVKQVAFHPHGELLASAGTDQTVRFWDMATGRERACFDWGIGKVCCVTFAPDGMTCAAGGDTGGVVLWDVDR